MASKLIGRAPCPECGFGAAHVKQSEKCIYRYCPECGAQHHARTPRQQADLMAKTRDEGTPTPTPTPTATVEKTPEPKPAPKPTATPTPSEATATPTPTPTPPKAKASLFGI